MDKNLIPQIAEMLGVELGEEFLLRNTETGFICSKEIFTFMVEDRCEEFNGKVRFKKKSDNGYQYHSSAYSTKIFQKLCEGKYEIVKMPWKPSEGQTVYSFYARGISSVLEVIRFVWVGSVVSHQALVKAGWVYRTRAEAEAALPAVAREMGVEYEL